MKLYRWLLLLVICLAACQWTEHQLCVNSQSTVLYKGGVTQVEAKRLGAFLLQQGYFNTYDKRQVHVQKRDSTYTVSFIIDVPLFTEDKENILAGFKVWHTWLQEQVFPASLVNVKLTNDKWKQLALITSPVHPNK